MSDLDLEALRRMAAGQGTMSDIDKLVNRLPAIVAALERGAALEAEVRYLADHDALELDAEAEFVWTIDSNVSYEQIPTIAAVLQEKAAEEPAEE